MTIQQIRRDSKCREFMKYKIHIYGGLGAQLSGVFVQKYFREKHEDLEVKLYLHNDRKFKYSYSEDGNELLTNKEDLLVLNDYLIPKHLRTDKYRSWEVFISYLKPAWARSDRAASGHRAA